MKKFDVVNITLIDNFIISHKITKKQFCKLCKINYSTLRKIYNGKNFIINSLIKIARVMEIKVSNFFE